MYEEKVLSMLILCGFLYQATCDFVHVPSAIEMKPIGDEKSFGFSMAYQNNSDPHLVVSAPASNYAGEVYRCPLGDLKSSVTCFKIDLGINAMNYSRDQHFYTGASVGATNNYIFHRWPKYQFGRKHPPYPVPAKLWDFAGTSRGLFGRPRKTCSPLWTTTINVLLINQTTATVSDAFGTCFMYDSTAHRYKGIVEQLEETHKELNSSMVENINCGLGWTILTDTVNNMILISKPQGLPDIAYLETEEPLAEVKFLSGSHLFDTNIVNHSTTELNQKVMRDNRLWNLGYGMAAGTFFTNETVYAVSTVTDKMTGQIIFLKKTGADLEFIIRSMDSEFSTVPVRIDDVEVGSLYGYAVGAADLNQDGLSELLVGAPAWSPEALFNGDGAEYGALHIYLGAPNITDNANDDRFCTIYSKKYGGRFGASIAASDIDGDNVPEIVVGAPYEDYGVGAVYIISGIDLKQIVGNENRIPVMELEWTQRIQRSEFKQLGYSIQIVPDADGNGFDNVAVGAPGSASVLLFRSFQTVKLSISANLHNGTYVRLQDMTFSVDVCVNITNSSRSSASFPSARFYITPDITGNGTSLENDDPLIMILSTENQQCYRVVVKITHTQEDKFVFTARIESDKSEVSNRFNVTDFNVTWTMPRPDSMLETKLLISRNCGEDCDPILKLDVAWTGGAVGLPYEIGSSNVETLILNVKNIGPALQGGGGCVMLEVQGAVIDRSCVRTQSGLYKCLLRNVIGTNDQYPINIQLDMRTLDNIHQALTVKAESHLECSKVENLVDPEFWVVANYSYESAQNAVVIECLSIPHVLTDIQLGDNMTTILEDNHAYNITNNGFVAWKNIVAEIIIERKPYINDVIITPKVNNVTKDADKIHYFYPLPLDPGSSTIIICTFQISKSEVIKYFKDGLLEETISTLKIDFKMSNYLKEKNLPIILSFEKDTTFGTNKTLLIAIGCVVGAILLAVTTFVLYKMDFFKRKQHKRLGELRESVRRRSIRLTSERSIKRSHMSAGDDQLQIEVVEELDDDAFEKDDKIVLVEEVAEIHVDAEN